MTTKRTACPARRRSTVLGVVLAAALGLGVPAPASAAEPTPAVAVDDAYVTDLDRAIGSAAYKADVLANDIGYSSSTVEVVSGPTHGTASIFRSGGLVYVPEPGFNGSDSLTYRLVNGTVSSNVATISLTVRPASLSLVTERDSYTTPAGVPLVVDEPGLVGNDSSPEGLPLRAVLVRGSKNGKVVLSASGGGAFTYTPDVQYEIFQGLDSFSYALTDGLAFSAPVEVTLRVRGSGPVVKHDVHVLDEGTTLVAESVLANDRAPEGTSMTAATVTGTRHGTLSFAPDGTFTYVPDVGFTGTDLFVYQASDDLDVGNLGLVMLVVVPVADVPSG
ncbi:Ig-like domain-containing protein [Sanguibacter antarcticus]|nr:Ig-like domain-containing protein [Sanguibacter antarcticus]